MEWHGEAVRSAWPSAGAQRGVLTVIDRGAEESDGALLDACRFGSAASWTRLYERHQRMVYSIPLSYGLGDADAADVAQATFTALIQSIDQIRDGRGLRHWLATVARRETWRLLALRRREPAMDRVPVVELDAGPGWERWEIVEWLAGALQELRPRCRDLITALYLEPGNPSYAQIADRLAMPVGSIGPSRARCLANLKAILQARTPGRPFTPEAQ